MDITVNTSTLASDITALREAVSMARAGLEEVFSQMAELDAMWEGPASQEFHRQFGNDYKDAGNLWDKVETMLACIEYAKERYNQCENETRDVIAAITL